jgi:hypothetical protein
LRHPLAVSGDGWLCHPGQYLETDGLTIGEQYLETSGSWNETIRWWYMQTDGKNNP